MNLFQKLNLDRFHSSGKLLLSAEYLVLCGAKALAIPTQKGQSMEVTKIEGESLLLWKAYNELEQNWFQATFELPELNIIDCDHSEMAQTIAKVLKATNYNWKPNHSYLINTFLEFNNQWGLGSSSTFIANIAKWSGCDAFKLLQTSFGGSGYDVAVGLTNSSLLYQLVHQNPQWEEVSFNPPFKDDLLFVYSGNKRISRDAISAFDCDQIEIEIINQATVLSMKMFNCETLSEFELLMDAHENLISKVIETKPIKESHFNDFEGSVKSLGAWGGDFFMATRKEAAMNYFSNKGYTELFTWDQLIKSTTQS